MLVPEEKPAGDKKKKWALGAVCLAAVAVSALSIVREMPHPSTPPINPSSSGRGGGGAPGGRQLPGTRGQITTVSADPITIQGRDGTPKTFTLTAATKITVDQKPVAATDLKAGQRARIISTDDKSASEVHIRTRPPGGRGGPGGGRGGPGGGGAAGAALS